MRYRPYLRSRAWEERKKRFFACRERRCEACAGLRDIEVHHVRYRNLGAEPDEDLVALCARCHRGVHSLADGIHVSLPVATRMWIANFKRNAAKRISTRS